MNKFPKIIHKPSRLYKVLYIVDKAILLQHSSIFTKDAFIGEILSTKTLGYVYYVLSIPAANCYTTLQCTDDNISSIITL